MTELLATCLPSHRVWVLKPNDVFLGVKVLDLFFACYVVRTLAERTGIAFVGKSKLKLRLCRMAVQ